MYWPLLKMYSENLDLGWGVLIIRRTFNNRMKGLYIHIYYRHMYTEREGGLINYQYNFEVHLRYLMLQPY